MILITQAQADSIEMTVAGTFSVADYQEFETKALEMLAKGIQPKALFDLRAMDGYTLDMLWEDLQFSRHHPQDFSRIAVVTHDEWVSWAAWINRLFLDVDVQIFEDIASAQAWLGIFEEGLSNTDSVAVVDTTSIV